MTQDFQNVTIIRFSYVRINFYDEVESPKFMKKNLMHFELQMEHIRHFELPNGYIAFYPMSFKDSIEI